MTDFKQGQNVLLGNSLEDMRPGIFFADDIGAGHGFRYVGRRVCQKISSAYRFCQPIPEKRPNLRRGDPVSIIGHDIDSAFFYSIEEGGAILTSYCWSAIGIKNLWQSGSWRFPTRAELEAVGYEAGHIEELMERWEK